MYVTVNLIDGSVRSYLTKEESLKKSIEINQKDRSHPSFKLYRLNGKKKAIYAGKLTRWFGTNKYFWDK